MDLETKKCWGRDCVIINMRVDIEKIGLNHTLRQG